MYIHVRVYTVLETSAQKYSDSLILIYIYIREGISLALELSLTQFQVSPYAAAISGLSFRARMKCSSASIVFPSTSSCLAL